MDLVSIVVPCYNEEDALPHFYNEAIKTTEAMPRLSFELLFVDDGSKDKTLSVIKELARNDSRVKYISFSRNFGKESALYAGLAHASGDYIAVMDADLQDPPSLLPEMLKSIEEEGYDCIATKRSTRKGEPPVRSFFARMFYSNYSVGKVFNSFNMMKIVDKANRKKPKKMVE